MTLIFFLKRLTISMIIVTLAGFSTAYAEETHNGLLKHDKGIGYTPLSDAPAESNDEWKKENKNQPETGLILQINPIEHRLTFKEDEIDHVVQLQNGTKAVYCFGNQFNILSFENDGWQYLLKMDKEAADMLTLDTAIAIANTLIETVNEK